MGIDTMDFTCLAARPEAFTEDVQCLVKGLTKEAAHSFDPVAFLEGQEQALAPED